MANLIVGIGGTGGKVIKALREHVARMRGEQEDNNLYLCLDTMTRAYFLDDVYGHEDVNTKAKEGGGDLDDVNHVSTYEQEVRRAVLPKPVAVSENEYIQLHGMSSALLNKLRKDRYAENGKYSWLEAEYLVNNLSVKERIFQFKEGAGQYRHIGRIGSFMTAKELDPWLSGVRGIDNVYIVCSVVGGTGSGNFIDIAAMIRHVLYRNNGEQPQIWLLSLMPGAFAEDVATKDYTSAYAAFRELKRMQSPVINGVPLCFEYEGVPRFSLDVNVFDQVTLLDYEAQTEDNRRNTVYPKIAEMVDLLTAGGTSVVTNVLANDNKRVRELQQGKENTNATQEQRDAWRGKSNEPYFCEFDSYRIMLPMHPYQLKAAARAVEALVRKLVGESIPYSLNHHNQTISWLNQMPGNLIPDFFGPDVKLEDEGFSEPGNDNFIPVTFKSFNDKSRKQIFLNHSANTLYDVACRVLAGKGAEAYIPVEIALPGTLATGDRKLSHQKLEEFNSLRKEYFAVTSLETIDSVETLRGNMGGRYGDSLARAIEAYRQKIGETYKELVGSLLQREPGGLRDLQNILLGLHNHFMRPMLKMLEERNEELRARLSAAGQQVRTKLQAYKQAAEQQKKGIFSGNNFKEFSESYLESERLLYDALLAYLSNHAFFKQMDASFQATEVWEEEVDRVLKNLGNNSPGTLSECAREAVKEIDEQLNTWVRSDAVSIGFPHNVLNQAVGSPEQVRGMYGLEDELYEQAMEKRLQDNNCIWKIDVRSGGKIALKLCVSGSASRIDTAEVEFGTTGFKVLHRILTQRFAPIYNTWTFKHYLDHLEKKGRSRTDISKSLVEYLSGQRLLSKVPDQIVSQYYIVCPQNNDQFILSLINNDMSRKDAHAIAIQVPGYAYELNVVKMSAGYVETDYKTLQEARVQYIKSLKHGSAGLKIQHILAEENNLVQFEQDHYKKGTKNDNDILMPVKLAALFSNKDLRYLFVGLFICRFIGSYDDPDNPSKNHRAFWCNANVGELRTYLSNTDKYNEFLDRFAPEGDSRNQFLKSHSAFRLNPPLKDTGKNADDFFVAMARFVQRAENAQSGHVANSFPFTIADVRELLQYLEVFFNGKSKNGGSRLQFIEDCLKGISPEAAKAGENIFAMVYSLGSDEEKEKFSEQLSSLLKEYLNAIKHTARPELIDPRKYF